LALPERAPLPGGRGRLPASRGHRRASLADSLIASVLFLTCPARPWTCAPHCPACVVRSRSCGVCLRACGGRCPAGVVRRCAGAPPGRTGASQSVSGDPVMGGRGCASP